MDLPVFALHSVLFPGERVALRVFEERYLRMMDVVLPDGTFVVAIQQGQEVGGPAEPFRVGVTASVRDHSVRSDGRIDLEAVGRDRVALVEQVSSAPYPVWRTEPFPDQGGAGTDDVECAIRAFRRFLDVTGLSDALPALPREPVVAGYVLAAAVPALSLSARSCWRLPAPVSDSDWRARRSRSRQSSSPRYGPAGGALIPP